MTVLPALLVEGLQRPTAYPHDCDDIEIIETHISWVVLTGEYAYKIKKPVDLAFVDFSTPQRRKHFCEEELRLNRRLSPDLYLKVVTITDGRNGPEIDGRGAVIDYAVCMRQFEHQELLSNMASSLVDSDHISNLADDVAEFHNNALVAAAESEFGNSDQIMRPVRENFFSLASADDAFQKCIERLSAGVESEFELLAPTFERRKRNGMIRECHGDLHLANMFLRNDRIQVFDGIEFNDDLRWIDIINDIAFTVMDLEERGYPQLARRFLNRWMEMTGDYAGVAVLPFYCAYRAAVRAKVDVIRLGASQTTLSEQKHLTNECCEYLDLASTFTQRHRPALIITVGVSGSGKTTATQQIIEACDVVRVRSDVERKRLFGLKPNERSDNGLRREMYSAKATTATYEHLAATAADVVDAGYPVVVDATFLKAEERICFARLAHGLGVPFLIIHCKSDIKTLTQRIRNRRGQQDASEADEYILQQQLDHHDRLSTSELDCTVDACEPNLPQIVMDRAGLTR